MYVWREYDLVPVKFFFYFTLDSKSKSRAEEYLPLKPAS